jgi:MFS family permease
MSLDNSRSYLFEDERKKKMLDQDTSELEWNNSDIIKLAICWALTLTTSTLLTTVAPLAANEIGVGDSLASFTVGCFLIGATVSSVPSGWLFRKYGRFGGFTVGCAFQLAGSILGSFGMTIESPPWVFMGCFTVGLGQVRISITFYNKTLH